MSDLGVWEGGSGIGGRPYILKGTPFFKFYYHPVNVFIKGKQIKKHSE